MGLLDQVLTPRGGRKAPQLAPLPLAQLSELKLSEGQPEAATPRTAARMGKLKSLARMLTPRRKQQPAPGADSTPGGLINAYRPTLTGMLEAQVRLQSARSSGGRRHLTTPSPGVAALCDSDSDSASEAGTDLSSLDGFGDYARCLEEAPGAAEGQGSTAPSPAADPDPDLP